MSAVFDGEPVDRGGQVIDIAAWRRAVERRRRIDRQKLPRRPTLAEIMDGDLPPGAA